MRLKATAWFRTVITVDGSNVPWTGDEGQTFEVSDEVAAALLRDLPGVLVPEEDSQPEPEPPVEAITAPVETVVEMVEVPDVVVAPPKVARTRQVARKPRKG